MKPPKRRRPREERPESASGVLRASARNASISLTRRDFAKSVATGTALAGVSLALSGSTGTATIEASGVLLQEEGDTLRVSNGLIELVLDRRNGYFRHIRNLHAEIEHKPATDGVWPFGLWLGDQKQPRQKIVEITADSPQTMTYRFRESAGEAVLEVNYPALVVNATGEKTGVSLETCVRFHRNRDYFIVTARLKNNSPLGITNFYAARGVQLTGDSSREEESVTTCFFGSIPRKDLKPTTRGHPIYGYSWYDYHGQRGSIGMAYINRQGMMMMFDISPDGDGIRQGWRMFNLKGYWHFEQKLAPEHQHMIYPLEPGQQFATDEWVIAPHRGDWHRMADIYRERYNEAFGNDYASYARAPQAAKDVYFWATTWLAVFQVYMQPHEFVARIKNTLSHLGVEAKHVGVSIHQGGTTWAKPQAPGSLSCPDFFPVAPEVGGTKALKEAIAELRMMGIRHVTGYVWVMGNHQNARNYVPEADASDWIPDWNPPGGKPPCVNNSAWLALWRDQIAPEFREIGYNSLYFDMGPVVWGICQGRGPTHLHGSSTIGILTGSVRGGVLLSKEIRRTLGPDGSTNMEASGDITGRWVDIWTAFAEPTLKYTWPDKIYFGSPTTVQGLNEALVYGNIPFVNFIVKDEVSETLGSSEGDRRLLGPLRRYLILREQLAGTPGYPDGFRDDVGLMVSDPNIVAKVFRAPDRGVTVVYYAKEVAQGAIVIDAGLLDNDWIGPPRREEVRLEKDEAGFFVIER